MQRLSTIPNKKVNQKAMAITDIFDQDTQQTIKEVEQFLQKVVKDKMYWTRDILNFYQIENEDVNVFLNFHQVYKHTILQKMNNNGFNIETNKMAGRAGSYWQRGPSESYDENDSEKSFYTKIQQYVI